MTCAKPCSCTPNSGLPGCNGYGPEVEQAPANTPPVLDPYACSVLGAVQSAVDTGRLVAHSIGARAYDVWLVWQVRDGVTGKWVEDAKLQLMPVLVSGLSTVDQVVSSSGRGDEGQVKLTEVSPIQVDEQTLQGYRNGQPWGNRDDSHEFFYEIKQISRCGDPSTTPSRRFIPNGTPEFQADRHQWVVRLIDQFGERTSTGQDQTVSGGFVAPNPAVLVP